jgi:hypothetical protein
MWALANRTPYAADRNWTRDKDGHHVWIVAVKATFDVTPNGALKLADEQVPPVLAPEHHGDPATTSLKYESDLLAVKPGTDVVLNARAYAPGGVPARSVDVLLRMDGVSKHLVVYGERLYLQGMVGGITTTDGPPFTTCPIVYEYAFGGSDLSDPDPARQKMSKRNPVGRGVAASTRTLVHQPAHRIEYVSGAPATDAPAGFGPIASHWSPRGELAGTYDAAWNASKKPFLPEDYDPRHALCSPEDQRSARWLRGGELVELVHMTPEGALRFELPRLYFAYTTSFGPRREEHRGHLATVIIEPDARRVMAVYQTSLIVPRKDVPYLDRTVIMQKEYVR